MGYIDNIAIFIRAIELGNFSAAGRDMRISPIVACNRIKELEKHLGVRLFNRTTRHLCPTEHARVFYDGAKKVLDALEEAEASIAMLSGQPRGIIRVAAPLGLGRRMVASGIPEFCDQYPGIEVRLRLTDHHVDMMKEGIDLAIKLDHLDDSSLCMRSIMNCDRVLAAAPDYLDRRGEPVRPEQLVENGHDCLLLRFPDTRECFWTLRTQDKPKRFEVRGPFDTDDGDVITNWALAGRGIVNKPRFEIEPFLREGRLKVVLPDTPPMPATLAAVYPHRKYKDPKVCVFVEFIAKRCQRIIRSILDAEVGSSHKDRYSNLLMA